MEKLSARDAALGRRHELHELPDLRDVAVFVAQAFERLGGVQVEPVEHPERLPQRADRFLRDAGAFEADLS